MATQPSSFYSKTLSVTTVAVSFGADPNAVYATADIQTAVTAAAAGSEGSEVLFNANGTLEFSNGQVLTLGGTGYTITFKKGLTVTFI